MASMKLYYIFITLWVTLLHYSEGSRTKSGHDCITVCRPRRKGEQPSCYYTRQAKAICDPEGDILEYFTRDGKKCNGKCGKFDADYYWCFDETFRRAACDITPRVHDYLPKTVPKGFTKNEYCHIATSPIHDELRDEPTNIRRKRQMNNGNGNNNQQSAGFFLNQVDRLVSTVFNDDNFLTLRFENPLSPVVAVATVVVPADPTSSNPEHRVPITLTVAMRANISYSHMGSTRDVISREVYDHLALLDRERDDEAGHLLADSLGGPGVPYNFVPQSPMLNRAVQGTRSQVLAPAWWDVEGMLRRYLIDNDDGYVIWNLYIDYLMLPSSRRPTSFRLSITFFNRHHVPTLYEGAVSREYFFPNVPTVACTDLAHPWWNYWPGGSAN